jgi:hypothetical protein
MHDALGACPDHPVVSSFLEMHKVKVNKIYAKPVDDSFMQQVLLILVLL